MSRKLIVFVIAMLAVVALVMANSGPVAPRLANKVLTGMEEYGTVESAPVGRPPSPSLDLIGTRYQAGTTWYDYQHNGSAGKMIDVDADGFVHVVWMNGLNAAFNPRHVYYNVWDPTSQTFMSVTGSQVNASSRGGYVSQVTQANGFCFPNFHETSSDNNPHTAASIDFLPRTGAFTTTQPTWYQGMQLIWPKIAQSMDGKLHVVSTESAPENQVWQRMAYSRGTPVFDGEYGDHIQWENVSGANQYWLFDTTTTIAPTIAAAHNSNRIAIAYTYSRYSYVNMPGLFIMQANNDLYLMQSEDGGVNWGAPENITNFIYPDYNCPSMDTLECNKDTFRVYTDTAIMFDQEDRLHLGFTTITFNQYGYPGFDADTAIAWVQQSGVWHWDEHYDQFTPIFNDYNFYYNNDTTAILDEGAWQFNAQRPSFAEDTTTGYLYCSIWKYEGDQWSTNLFRMGDAYVAVSTNRGRVWSEAVNVTDTDGGQNTPAPNSQSERDITIAPYVSYDTGGNGYLHMEYVFDHDAGSIAHTEGVATLNEVYYQRIPVNQIPAEPILSPFWPAFHVDSTGFPFDLMVSANDAPKALPSQFTLHQNYPNPFNPTTNIQFDLARAANVTLKVFNVAGQEVATVINGKPMTAGVQMVSFDATDLASGVYLYRLEVDGAMQSKKMVLMK